MFRDQQSGFGGGLRIRGTVAEILYGYQPAAVLRTWSIEKSAGQWLLSATFTRVDKWRIRQTHPRLMFSAPRPGRFWAWDVFDVQVGDGRLVAKLGPPLQ